MATLFDDTSAAGRATHRVNRRKQMTNGPGWSAESRAPS